MNYLEFLKGVKPELLNDKTTTDADLRLALFKETTALLMQCLDILDHATDLSEAERNEVLKMQLLAGQLLEFWEMDTSLNGQILPIE